MGVQNAQGLYVEDKNIPMEWGWLRLPSMIEEGLDSAADNILNSGVLVFKCLRTMELLTRLSVYFDERIDIVGYGTFNDMYKMEMSNASAGGLWIPMNSFDLFGDTSRMIHLIANVNDQLFTSC
ncbi:hypothetical protein ACTXT7_000254 [Hymenolepis weldensis]